MARRNKSEHADVNDAGQTVTTDGTPTNGDSNRIKKRPTFARYILFGRNKVSGALVQLHDADNRRRLVKWFTVAKTMVLDNYDNLTVLRAKPVTLSECGIEV